MVLVFLLCGGICMTGCKKNPCKPEDFEGFKIEVNLDPERNYLTASGQMIGIIKVSVKNAANQVVDGNSLSGIGIAFEISGGGKVMDWEGKDFTDGFAPITNQFTELQWFMGEELGANQLTLSLKRKLKIERKPGFEFCEVPVDVVSPVVYNSTVIRTNEAGNQLPERKIFIVGDGPEENPNFIQVWVENNYGQGSKAVAEGANNPNINGRMCYDDEEANCLSHGPLFNWLDAVNTFNPESQVHNYVLPTSSQIVALRDYLKAIGYPNMSEFVYYFSNKPFNLDNRRGGYYGYQSPGSSTPNELPEFRKINEYGLFWTGTRNSQNVGYASAYFLDEPSFFDLIQIPIESYLSVRLIEKQRE